MFSVEREALAEIHSSSEVFGKVADGSALDGIPICGVIYRWRFHLIEMDIYSKNQFDHFR